MNNFKKLIAVVLSMVVLMSALPVTSAMALGYESMELGFVYQVYVDTDNPYQFFEFTPSKSDYYSICSTGYEDSLVTCYDEDGNIFGYDDDSGIDFNFEYIDYFYEGVTYLLEFSGYFSEECLYEVRLKNLGDVEITKLLMGNSYTASLDEFDSDRYFSFTPSESDYYAFYSSGDEDSYAVVYDSDWMMLNEDDDSGEQNNYCVNCYLEEGYTYYLKSSSYEANVVMSYEVAVEKTEVVEYVEILQYPYKMDYYEGDFGLSLDLSGLELELTYTDGTVVQWNYDDFEELVGTYMYIDYFVDDYGDYYVCVQCDFAEAMFNLNVRPNPIASIAVNTYPDRKYVYGDEEYGFMYDGVYYLLPYDLTGLSITVNYKDGTAKTYTDADIDMDKWTIDGESFDMVTIPIYEAGIYENTIVYMGTTFTYEFEVIEQDSSAQLGDVDGDGEVSVLDATAIQLHIAKLKELSDEELSRADTDGDGEVSVLDATQIQLYIAKLIPEL